VSAALFLERRGLASFRIFDERGRRLPAAAGHDLEAAR